MNKKIVIGISIITLLILGGSVFFVSKSSPVVMTASANSSIEVATKEYGFGTVAINGPKVTKTYTIKNSGSEPLSLTNVKTSCACTTATVTINGIDSQAFGMHTQSNWIGTVDPGDSADINVLFDQAFHGPQGTGDITRVISFETNDAKNPVVELMMNGKVVADNELKKEVSFTPESKELGTVIYGDVIDTTYTLTNNTTAKVLVTRVTTSCSCTSATLDKEELEPGESTNVNVSFNPAVHKDDTDLGELTRTIFIETDSKDFPKLQVSFNANVIKK